MSTESALAEALVLTLDQLITFVDDGNVRLGSSASAGVSQVQIRGKWYEIQMRLEGSEKSFIGEQGVVQSVVMGESTTMS